MSVMVLFIWMILTMCWCDLLLTVFVVCSIVMTVSVCLSVRLSDR